MSFLRTAERVVVPIDLAFPTVDAVATALEIARDAKNVHVAYALPEAEHERLGEPSEPSRVNHAREALRSWLVAEGFDPSIRTHVRVARPEVLVDELCRALDAQLVVLHARGRTGLSRVLLGSVAERVARQAPCPVLLLKGPM